MSYLDKLREETASLESDLLQRIEDVVRFLYPAGKKDNDQWWVGDKRGTPGDSFAVTLRGRWRGWGYDRATRKGVDIWHLWQLARGVNFKEAREEAASFLAGGFLSKTSVPLQKGIKLLRSGAASMPLDVFAEYQAGVELLKNNVAEQRRIAAWRGWDVGFVGMLARQGWLFSPIPKYVNEPVLAFLVGGPLGDKREWIWTGYHARKMLPGTDWLYRPSLQTHGLTIPPSPLLLGNLNCARTLIMVEGEWDALSLVFALRWWTPEALAIPAEISIIGIRGLHTWGSFIPAYLGMWQPKANALLLPMNHHGVPSWKAAEDGYTLPGVLKGMCGIMRVLHLPDHKDWNDAIRARDEKSYRALREAIAEILGS